MMTELIAYRMRSEDEEALDSDKYDFHLSTRVCFYVSSEMIIVFESEGI